MQAQAKLGLGVPLSVDLSPPPRGRRVPSLPWQGLSLHVEKSVPRLCFSHNQVRGLIFRRRQGLEETGSLQGLQGGLLASTPPCPEGTVFLSGI